MASNLSVNSSHSCLHKNIAELAIKKSVPLKFHFSLTSLKDIFSLTCGNHEVATTQGEITCWSLVGVKELK